MIDIPQFPDQSTLNLTLPIFLLVGSILYPHWPIKGFSLVVV